MVWVKHLSWNNRSPLSAANDAVFCFYYCITLQQLYQVDIN